MEPVRQSRRIQEKSTKEEVQTKPQKTRSQSKSKTSPAPKSNRAKSNKPAGKTPPKGKSKERSASRGTSPSRGRSGTGQDKSNPPAKTTRRSRNGQPKDSLILAREHLQSNKRTSRSKRKQPSPGELKNKRTSGSAKRVKKSSQKSAEREKVPKKGKGHEVEEVDESQSEASSEIQVEKKTNKKKVEGIKKSTATKAIESEKEQKKQVNIMEVLVTCKGSHYNIWRKIYISDEMPFTRLARIIVTAMGWMGLRHWNFLINDVLIEVPPNDPTNKNNTISKKKYADEITLEDFKWTKNMKFQFLYGENDDIFVHDILIEDISQVDRNPKINTEKNRSVNHAVLITGNTAVPNDEITVVQYEKLMEAWFKGPANFKEFKQKNNGDCRYYSDYDPDQLDKEEINDSLKIHLYDYSKMPKELVEDDIFWTW